MCFCMGSGVVWLGANYLGIAAPISMLSGKFRHSRHSRNVLYKTVACYFLIFEFLFVLKSMSSAPSTLWLQITGKDDYYGDSSRTA